MKTRTFTLTSEQILGIPDLANGYLFLDPVFGTSINFPLVADGDTFLNNSYTQTFDDGLFVPWGYIFQNVTQTLTAEIFKGPYDVTFTPSVLDTRYYAVLKIIYDFDDGSEPYIVERSVVQQSNSLIASLNSGPAGVSVTHQYWPRGNGVTTYRPSISVINGNLAQNVYKYEFNFVPVSLFDLNSFHLLNTAQHVNSLDETLGVFELDSPEYVTNARFFSGGTTGYNVTPIGKLINYNDIPGLILNLDASDSLSIIKDASNKVSYWSDKSSAGNDFSQSNSSTMPVYLNKSQSESGRRSVHFNLPLDSSSSIAPHLVCINDTGFNTITAGYTAFFVMKANNLLGTVFNGGVSQSVPNNLLFKIIPNRGVSVYQGTSGVEIRDVSYVVPRYSIFTVTIPASGQLDVTLDNQVFNYKRLNFIKFGEVNDPATISLPTNPRDTDLEISQILIYNRPLTGAEYNNVYEGLISKWGISLRDD